MQSEDNMKRILSDKSLWGADLSALSKQVYAYLTAIRQDPRAAVEALLA